MSGTIVARPVGRVMAPRCTCRRRSGGDHRQARSGDAHREDRSSGGAEAAVSHASRSGTGLDGSWNAGHASPGAGCSGRPRAVNRPRSGSFRGRRASHVSSQVTRWLGSCGSQRAVTPAVGIRRCRAWRGDRLVARPRIDSYCTSLAGPPGIWTFWLASKFTVSFELDCRLADPTITMEFRVVTVVPDCMSRSAAALVA